MAAFEKCIEAIQNAAGRRLSDDELDGLVSQVQNRAAFLKARGIENDAQAAALRAADQVGNQLRENAVIEARNAAINGRIRLQFGDWSKTHYPGKPSEALETYLVGTNRPKPGARNSVAATRKAIADGYVAGITSDLHATGALKVLASGTLDRDVARALWASSRKDASVLRTLPRTAVELANVIAKWQEHARVEANKAGAWIAPRAGFIVTQTHDALKIVRAKYEQWSRDIAQKLDLPAMMAQSGERDLQKMLGAVYREVTGASAEKAPAASELVGHKGPGNLAARISASRELIFKDADAWMDYNDRYGSGNLRESVIGGLRSRGEETGLMRAMGTNPGSMYETMIADLHSAHEGAPEAGRAFNQDRAKLDRYMRAVDGSMDRPAKEWLARFGANVRAFESVTKLGRALASQFSDIAAFGSEMSYQGHGFLSGMGEAIAGLGTNFRRQDRIELLSAMGATIDGLSGEISRSGSLDEPGAFSKMQRTFFKYNLMGWWTEHMKGAAAMGMSHFMALQTKRAWESVSPDFRRVLSLYDIDGPKWALIRKTARTVGDREYVTPETIHELPREAFADYLRSRGQNVSDGSVSELRDEIERNLRTYFNDRVSFAALEPDAKTRAIGALGTQKGTPEGELLRSMAQFKSFGIAFVQKVIGRELYGRGYEGDRALGALFHGNGELSGMANLILMTTLFGYGSMAVKSLLKGQEARDPTDPKTWVAAMVQGGGMGLYGDFLFSGASRTGAGFAQNAVGPGLSTFGDVLDLWQRMREGDDFAARTFKLAIVNTPFVNLFYIRPALDYMILYRIQESMNPGFTRRLESEAKKRGTEFLLKPSEFAH